MKKFTKCTFVIAAVVSTLFLCIYKLKYDRLYNVMQVLEVFGTPSEFHSCERKNAVKEINVPSWVAIQPGIQAYSAHCSSVPAEIGACPQVNVLAIHDTSEEIEDLLCKFWIEESTQPILGTFSHHVLKEDLNHSSIILSCQSKYTSKVPFGISFFKKEDKSSTVIPVTPVPTSPTKNPGVLVCIAPLPDNILETSSILKENILFHSMLGVTRFIIYSNTLPHSVQSVAVSLQIKSQVQVQTRGWNTAVHLAGQVTDSLVQQDCYEQSKLHAHNYIILKYNQIMMPAVGANITQTLISYPSQQGPITLSVRRFCSEYPNDKKSSTLQKPVSILQSTYYNSKMSENVTTELIKRETRGFATNNTKYTEDTFLQTNLRNQLHINEYGSCNSYDFNEKDETAVYEDRALRFIESFPSFIKSFGH